jgi:flagellar biogenesis protein FliO
MADAATTHPASMTPSNLIHRGVEPTVRGASGKDSTGAGAARVVLSLATVVGLILLVYYMARRMGGGHALGGIGGASAQPIRVISRVAISSKQRLLLIQVGRRVIVVADNGQRIEPLCEIDGPDEVEELLGQCETRRAAAGRDAAPSRLRAHLPWPVMRSTNRIEPEPDDLTDAQQQISGLLQRVRGIARRADGA